MSLIQDALKRKSEEPAALHSTGLPGRMAEPPADGKSPRVWMIMLSVLIVLLLAGIGLYLIKPKVVQTAIQAPAPVAPVYEPAAVAVVPVQNIKTEVVETAVEPAEEKPAPEQLKTAWPELKLTGVARGDKNLAILNGKMLSAGRKLGEVTIIEVSERNIIVEYRGERRVLYMDE